MARLDALIAGRYRLATWLAAGGMGEVWIAVDELLSRQVAVKVVKPEYAGNPAFRERLLAEARAAAAVHHPRVVDVYDVGDTTDDEGRPEAYIVMELAPGRSLASRLTEGPLDPKSTVTVIGDVAAALAAAHRSGVIHRDIKPANLMVDNDARTMVLDFGIARAAHVTGLTAPGMVMGTARYISPEQAAGKPATAASDIYSLGIVAHQCLVGRPPFEAESEVATALAHINQPVPELPSWVPGPLGTLITACLAKDPGDRPTAELVAATAAAPDLATLAAGVAARTGTDIPRWLRPAWVTTAAAAAIAGIVGLTVMAAGEGTASSASAAAGRPDTLTATTAASAIRLLPGEFSGQRWQVVGEKLRTLGLQPVLQVEPGGQRGIVTDVEPVGVVQPTQVVTVYASRGPAPVHVTRTPGARHHGTHHLTHGSHLHRRTH